MDYIEFEVSLLHIRPRIWRRFLLRADASFRALHDAIHATFGWGDEHLWQFMEPGRRGAVIAGPPDVDDDPDAADVPLATHFKRRAPAKCRYVYDFGDMWDHEIVGTKRTDVPGEFERRLLDGARAAPREDCGGLPGYHADCAFVATGKHPHLCSGDARDFIGTWRPDGFDLAAVQRRFDRA